ncbi:MAG: class I SAM-dependent methyltransferase [Acidimicrobiia bacterium]|nr:class I SAM-dependent methyltransferase [Acidimicrobiia bacterium]
MSLNEVLRQAQDLGFFGPGELRRHREHASAFVDLVLQELGQDTPERFLDLGSGGGLPGLVLAEALSETPGTLLDSQHRRTVFLEQAVAELGWGDRIAVVNARAEDAARDPGHRCRYSLVVARSFAAPAVTAECAVGFLRPGARLIVSEPPTAEPAPPDASASGATVPGPGRWDPGGLTQLGFDPPVPRVTSRPGATIATLTFPAGPLDRWPRRSGIPSKRPLW